MANILMVSRMVLAVFLLFVRPFSGIFCVCFIAGGLTDMADGYAARRAGTESSFGARLDSAADLVFTAVCLVKLLPVVRLRLWLWIWIAGIAVIKVINLISGYVCQGKFVMLHTAANKGTGFLLFLLPLCIRFLDLHAAAVPVCVIATFAAIQEGHLIRTNHEGGCIWPEELKSWKKLQEY